MFWVALLVTRAFAQMGSFDYGFADVPAIHLKPWQVCQVLRDLPKLVGRTIAGIGRRESETGLGDF